MNSKGVTPSQGESKGFLDIDVNRILFQVIRYWYVIALSILLCGSVAYLINRYSKRQYAVNASIIIRETEEASSGKLLYNNPLVKFYRNYQNEIYLLKSIPLMERTVR